MLKNILNRLLLKQSVRFDLPYEDFQQFLREADSSRYLAARIEVKKSFCYFHTSSFPWTLFGSSFPVTLLLGKPNRIENRILVAIQTAPYVLLVQLVLLTVICAWMHFSWGGIVWQVPTVLGGVLYMNSQVRLSINTIGIRQDLKRFKVSTQNRRKRATK